MNTEVMFSSKKMDWATPQDFYDKLNSEFHFTLDPCADESNHKCDKYFTMICTYFNDMDVTIYKLPISEEGEIAA